MTSGATVSPGDRKSAIRFIVCFGLVSLFADMTYEGAHAGIAPLLDQLGASIAAIAIVSGFGEMIAASLRFFSGRLADRTHAYWTLAIAGYAMNVLAIPGLAFVQHLAGGRGAHRHRANGESHTGPARDLLLSEATGRVGHGWGFGLHAAMDQTGACAGPLLMAFLVARTGQFKPAFAWLAIPAVLALASILAARGSLDQRARPNRNLRNRCHACSGRTSPPPDCSRADLSTFPSSGHTSKGRACSHLR